MREEGRTRRRRGPPSSRASGPGAGRGGSWFPGPRAPGGTRFPAGGPGPKVVGLLWLAFQGGAWAQSLPRGPGGGGGPWPGGGGTPAFFSEILPPVPATGEPVRFRYVLPPDEGEGWTLQVPPGWHVLEPLEKTGETVGGGAIWEALLIPLRPGELPAPLVGGPEAAGGRQLPSGTTPGAPDGPAVPVRSLLPPPPSPVEPAPLLPGPGQGRRALPHLLLAVGLLGLASQGLRKRPRRASPAAPRRPRTEAHGPPSLLSEGDHRAVGSPTRPPPAGDLLRELRALAAAWEGVPPPPPPTARGILDQVAEGTRTLLGMAWGESLAACTTAELLERAAEREGGSPPETLRICLEAADRGRFGPERGTTEAFSRSLQGLKAWIEAQGAVGGKGRRKGPDRKGSARLPEPAPAPLGREASGRRGGCPGWRR